MEYVRPKAEKVEARQPPISANFAPPPVEHPAVLPLGMSQEDGLEGDNGQSEEGFTPSP